MTTSSVASHRRHAIALVLAFAAAGCGSALAADDEVWITLGSDAYSAIRHESLGPLVLAPPPKLAETDGVVMTRVTRAAVEAVAERIHAALHRCGGFVAHATQAEAEAELARVAAATPSPTDVTAVPFLIDQPQWVQSIAAAVDETRIVSTITQLSTDFPNRYHRHPSGTVAAERIRDLWLGYAGTRTDVTVQLVNHGTATPQPSVMLTVTGTTRPDQFVVLGAHLDSTRSGIATNPQLVAPGADDDASGVASLSEALRVLLASGYRPARSLRFFAYAAEEVGLVGSNAIATDHYQQGTQVLGALQLDMTGYKGSSEDIALVTDFTDASLNAFIGSLVDTYQPTLVRTTTLCGYACSDPGSWQRRGYPAAFPFEAKFSDSNHALHTLNDTLATLSNSGAHAAKFARLAVAFAVEAGLDDVDGIFANGFD